MQENRTIKMGWDELTKDLIFYRPSFCTRRYENRKWRAMECGLKCVCVCVLIYKSGLVERMKRKILGGN